jgi:hypothetical protein
VEIKLTIYIIIIMKKVYKLKSEIWLYPSEISVWRFVSVPPKETAEIDRNFKHKRKGWRSLPVSAKIGKTVWKTSIFLDHQSKVYILPLKAQIRKKENIFDGDVVNFQIKILV